jgi:hypothetical protein
VGEAVTFRDKPGKETQIFSGCVAYFHDALAAVAAVSVAGNEQHNPGEPLHWARGKSMNQIDCLQGHLIKAGTFDNDGHRHSAKVAWRALALLQLEIEEAEGLPPSRGSKVMAKLELDAAIKEMIDDMTAAKDPLPCPYEEPTEPVQLEFDFGGKK